MPQPLPLVERGKVNETTAGGWWQSLDDEQVPELRWPLSVGVYDRLRRDSQAASVLRAVKLPIRRTAWRVDPNGARDEVAELIADDFGLPLVGADPEAKKPRRARDRFSWPDHLRHALLELDFGHSFFEQNVRLDADGRVRLRKLGPRLPRSLTAVNVADDGGLVSIEQGHVGKGVKIPVDRLVAYVNEREGGNWLGISMLRPAYKHWLIKDRLLRVQAQAIERNGMGIPKYTASDAEDPEAEIAKGLVIAQGWRAGSNAAASIPNGSELDLVGVTGTLPDPMPAIRYHDEQIARSVLAHFLNLGTQTGSWALGSTFADFFALSLQALAEHIADVTTQHVIEDLVDWNFGEDEPAPRLVFDEIGSQPAALANALKMLVDSGVILPDRVLEEFIRQALGLPGKAFPAPAPTAD